MTEYKTIDELVIKVDERNTDELVSTLIGLSIDKCFIKSVANVNGTDLSKYKIIRKDDFAVSLMQVSRDEKIPVARMNDYDTAIMSPAYPIFRVKDTTVIMPEYLEMWFKRPEFDREAAFIAVGGVRGSMPWEEFAKMKLPVPPIKRQREIVNGYRAVQNRILVKQKINDNLEDQMKAIFDEYVVSNDAYEYDEALDDSIDFINGLAMQNFRPEENDTALPVIKIRELSQGCCDANSEYCTSEIDSTHIINNGDLVFSWSGSLQAAIWTAGTAGLNQHLFKVQSSKYPLWFVYRWVIYHLLNFQRIAENKGTTFGHIKREDLHSALIKSLNNDQISRLNKIFNPLIIAAIENSTELHRLMDLQRVLLAQLSR